MSLQPQRLVSGTWLQTAQTRNKIRSQTCYIFYREDVSRFRVDGARNAFSTVHILK